MHSLKGFRSLPGSPEEQGSLFYQTTQKTNNNIPPGLGDYYFNIYGAFLGRSEKGSGLEGKGLVKIMENIPSFKKIGGYAYIYEAAEKSSKLVTNYSFDISKNYTGTPARMLQNIAYFFAKNIKIKAPISVSAQQKRDKNGDMGIMFECFKMINIAVTAGKIYEHLQYYSFFENALFHEYLHYKDEIEINKQFNTDKRHFDIYIEQIDHSSFMEMPHELRYGILGNVADYIENYWNNENKNGNYEPLIKMVDDLNKRYKKTGGVLIVTVLGRISTKVERKK